MNTLQQNVRVEIDAALNAIEKEIRTTRSRLKGKSPHDDVRALVHGLSAINARVSDYIKSALWELEDSASKQTREALKQT